MRRFNRNYQIQIQDPQKNTITINPPFTVKFSITRNTLASANKCSLEITNLSPKTRGKIYKDRYNVLDYWKLVIKAGYSRLETVFQGNIYEAYSYKSGTEWTTKMEGFDGLYGIQNGFSSASYESGTPRKNILQDLIGNMQNTIAGNLGAPADGNTERGTAMIGQSSVELGKFSADQYYIDNEVVNVVADNEVDTSSVIILDGNQLLSTPRRRDASLDADILFLPDCSVGKLCEIRSSEPVYNGQYKIMGFKHDFIWSASQSGIAKTSISLYTGAGVLNAVR